LKSLLERNHRMNPEYGGGLANHCSMGLLSLAALGGTSEQLSRFADSELVLLDVLGGPAGPAVTANNWTDLLGKREALPGFLALFRREIAERVLLVEIARDEEARYHDPLYRLAAARRMRLDGR
jgi:hypothetical protein